MFQTLIHRAIGSMLPRGLTLGLQRLRAKQIRNRWAGYWPIYEASGNAPEGWPGWPEEKEFALVLSHDVCGPKSLSRCRQLAEIEMAHGLRSSFNFTFNDKYEVPRDLVDWLRINGFEIGVCETRDKAGFLRQTPADRVQAINRQLRSLKASGVRIMRLPRNAVSLHDLKIEYDASISDFDLFAEQPLNAQTVFPFWVPRPEPDADAISSDQTNEQRNGSGGKGYIAIPSTLVTDYNLFVLLQERTIDVWRQKLRWLAEKRAMAMLVTHPNCMAIQKSSVSSNEYSVELYQQFLECVQTEFGDRFWSALPREMAAYCRAFRPQQARPPRRVAMLSYSFYKSDNRVRRYAETLARRGDHVRVFCLGKEEQVRSQQWDTLNGVKIRRLQTRATRESGKWSYAFRLARFFWKAQESLSQRNSPDGCDLLHVHNVPDFLVFAGWRLKLGGTPIILDIHDIVPEFYEAKFSRGGSSMIAGALRRIERMACQFADHVLISNHIWKKTLVGRSAPSAKVTALINSVDLALFCPTVRTRDDDRLVLIYPGTLNYHQGIDVAIDAMQILLDEFPRLELHIYGNGSALRELKDQTAHLRLAEHVRFFPGVFLDQVPALMANADIGIVPKRAEGFGGQAYSTKIMEFMSQGLPAVVSRTPIDSLYFDDSVVAFFESGNSQDFARAIREVIRDPDYRQRLSQRGLAYADANSWQTMKNVYLDLVNRLTMTALPDPHALPQTPTFPRTEIGSGLLTPGLEVDEAELITKE